jgi:hypothetical protein
MKHNHYLQFVKVFLLLIFLLLSFSESIAANDDKSDIKKIVKGWLKTSPPYIRAEQRKNPFQVDDLLIEVRSEDQSEIVAYVYNLKPAGYVIVSPDDRINPVIAYSTESVFDPAESEENILLHLLRRDISERERALNEGKVPADYISQMRTKRRNLETAGDEVQRSLQKAGPVKLSYDIEFGPFLQSNWGQSNDGYANHVFNIYTPYNYVCGCVATAMSQILYYYQWPLTGTGFHSYTWDNGVDPRETLSADFGAVSYDWDHMINYYYGTVTTAEEREAAGLLTSHCGLSVDMYYTSSSGSSASVGYSVQAIDNFFRMSGVYLSYGSSFLDTLYQNMEDAMPALLSIYSTPENAGHAIVTDGVQHDFGGTKYYHLNMGWNGSNNGWYDISNPFTAYYSWDVIRGGVLHIFPKPDLEDPGTAITVTDDTLHWQISNVISADKYEIQQAYIDSETVTFTETAESGLSGWSVMGNWTSSTSYKVEGNSSFRSYMNSIYQYGFLQLDHQVHIDPSMTISYWWGAKNFHWSEARLEISTDENIWTPIQIHREAAFSLTWHQVTISAAELSAYHHQTVSLRFAVEDTSDWYYNGDANQTYGFFLDLFTITDYSPGYWNVIDDEVVTGQKPIRHNINGDYFYRIRPYYNGRWHAWSDIESISVNALKVTARVYIEGAYEAGTDDMRLDLNTAGYLPADSPYPQDPVTCSAVPDSVTDWVLVELRSDAAGPAVEQRSALLSKHGYICNTGGSQGVLFDAPDGSYYIVIRHRNHLPVMSALKADLYR